MKLFRINADVYHTVCRSGESAPEFVELPPAFVQVKVLAESEEAARLYVPALLRKRYRNSSAQVRIEIYDITEIKAGSPWLDLIVPVPEPLPATPDRIRFAGRYDVVENGNTGTSFMIWDYFENNEVARTTVREAADLIASLLDKHTTTRWDTKAGRWIGEEA